MKKLTFISILSALILISSCSSTKKISGSKVSPVFITNSKKYFLIAPENIQKNIDNQIMLEGSFGDKSFNLLSYVQADENGINISLFNDFGTSMGELAFDGLSVAFESPVFPKKLKPEYIIADLQFAYYKADSIKEVLNQIKMTMDVSEKDGTETRIIKNGNTIIEEITKTSSVVTITNKLRGYQYILTEAQE